MHFLRNADRYITKHSKANAHASIVDFLFEFKTKSEIKSLVMHIPIQLNTTQAIENTEEKNGMGTFLKRSPYSIDSVLLLCKRRVT